MYTYPENFTDIHWQPQTAQGQSKGLGSDTFAISYTNGLLKANKSDINYKSYKSTKEEIQIVVLGYLIDYLINCRCALYC